MEIKTRFNIGDVLYVVMRDPEKILCEFCGGTGKGSH